MFLNLMTRRILDHLSPLPLVQGATPVERIESLGRPGVELWVKRDDRTHEAYGGNKVRKLEWLLADAHARGAKKIVTIGAVGSHHVLATTYFGTRQGLEVEAVLVPQPMTPHALEVLRADLGLGLKAFPMAGRVAVPLAVAWRAVTGAVVIPVGGSNVVGSMGYVRAARELAEQVRRGELPEPDVCVVALGSGGTAAGLAAGFEAEGLKTTVVGVCVADPAWAVRAACVRLARACGSQLGLRWTAGALDRRLSADLRFLGEGYGVSTREGDDATALAREAAGLELDPTYTAKAFASALWHVRARRGGVILYWHTLSGAPMQPLLANAPTEEAIPPHLRRLARTTP
jgi:D-cysteine desulfhydrase